MRRRISTIFLCLLIATALFVVIPPSFSQEFPHIEAEKRITPSKATNNSDVEITIVLRGAGGMILTPVDVALVMDRSGSMTGNKIEDAKDAATVFLDFNDDRDRVALVSYSSDIKSGELTVMNEEGKDTFIAEIEDMRAAGATDIYDALVTAMGILLDSPRTFAPPVIILLTDGLHNFPSVLPDSEFQALAEDAEAEEIIIYTIGLGADVNQERLRLIAETTGGRYFFAPSSEELRSIYEEIGRLLAFAGTNIEVTETIPSYMTYNNDASKTPDENNIVGDERELVWDVGTLMVGEEWEVTYTAEAEFAVESDDQTIQTKIEYITAEAAAAIINLPPGLIYNDIEVTGLTVEPSSVFQGELLNITVRVANNGLKQTSFELRTSYNVSTIDDRTLTLDVGEEETVEFKWNTSDVEGSVQGTSYNVVVEADPDEDLWEITRTNNQATQLIEIKVQPENIWWIFFIIFLVIMIAVGGVAYSKLRQEVVSYECPVCRQQVNYDYRRGAWYCHRCRRYYRM